MQLNRPWAFLFLLFSISPLFAQYKDNTVNKYYPFYDNAKNVWGYADSLGNVLIKPKFKDVKGFYQGYALAQAETGWGVINERTKWVIEPKYYDALSLSDGSLKLYINKHYDITYKFIVDGKIVDARPDDIEPEVDIEFFAVPDQMEIDTDAPVEPAKPIAFSPGYDSVWVTKFSPTIFYGRRHGKITLIYANKEMKKLHEGTWRFDDAKVDYPVAKAENYWYWFSWTGKEFHMNLIGNNIDDIFNVTGGSINFYYRKNSLVGVIINDYGEWITVPANFNTIDERNRWFLNHSDRAAYSLFDVTLPNGKKGPVTANGVLLFK
jgi:hypothetical protein